MIFVSDLCHFYGDKKVLDGLSFSLPSKGLVGFLGVNGAGKTTTLRLLTGFLTPRSGQIQINGFDVDESSMEAKGSIGYLPEKTPLYTHMRVREFLTFRAQLKQPLESPSSLEQMVALIMEDCSLTDQASVLIGHLSKGYRQRVGLAEALLWWPPVLILDEPTVGLDPHQCVEVRSLIQSLAEDRVVLFSSHNLSEVQSLCDTVLVLHEGSICAQGTPQELETRLIQKKITLDVLIPSSDVDAFKSRLEENVDSVICDSRFDLSEDCFTFELSIGEGQVFDICQKISTLCFQEGYLVVRLMPRQLSLEEIFLSLTTKDSDNCTDEVQDETLYEETVL